MVHGEAGLSLARITGGALYSLAALASIGTAQDPRTQFFSTLQSLCGARFEGAKTFPDTADSFTGKLLLAHIASCTETEIRVPFLVGEDRSRTWVFSRPSGVLRLQHDHRHADGTPDSVTMYGGDATLSGTALAQSFPADSYTARLIPAAATNVWAVSLSADRATLTYHLQRNARPRFTAVLRRVATPAPPADSVDVLVRGGAVYDGAGGAARRVDVGIRGDRVSFIGNATEARLTATRTIDATGLIVAPGFIDPHTHSFEGLPGLNAERRKNTGALMQGVTTVVAGADGRGPLDVERVLTESERLGIGTNTYALAGFGSARVRVMGASSAPASAAQIDAMRGLIARAMEEGAFGVGSGLFYAPQAFASTDEVIAVLKGATPFGGVYDTHQRDESSYSIGLLNSVREAIRIGRETGLTTNLGHVKALGVDVWGCADSVLALMRQARAGGHLVVADQYPWTASGTGLGSSLLPRWAQAGGRDSLLLRIANPATRDRILAEMRDNLRRRGGDSTLLLTGGGTAARPFLGRTLKQVAAERSGGAVETALELIRTVGDIGVASFNMTERDIETFMKDPFVMTSSDGSGGHPRLYGTYPRKIRRYVLDKPVVLMERMIESASGQVALVYGIPQRGTLREGYFADLIVFDPNTIREEATYVEPEKLSTGIRWVFVNGQAAVAEGVPTGALAGRALRKPLTPR